MVAKKTASRGVLEEIHNLAAKVLLARLRELDAPVEEGKPVPPPLTAAEITAITKFLKDNEITAEEALGHVDPDEEQPPFAVPGEEDEAPSAHFKH